MERISIKFYYTKTKFLINLTFQTVSIHFRCQQQCALDQEINIHGLRESERERGSEEVVRQYKQQYNFIFVDQGIIGSFSSVCGECDKRVSEIKWRFNEIIFISVGVQMRLIWILFQKFRIFICTLFSESIERQRQQIKNREIM